MQYKVRYRPLEKLGREGWHRFSDAEQQQLIDATAGSTRFGATARSGDSLPESSGKDGMPLVAQPFSFTE